jgi:hypothetical protein
VFARYPVTKARVVKEALLYAGGIGLGSRVAYVVGTAMAEAIFGDQD